jgi:hypothetical protein
MPREKNLIKCIPKIYKRNFESLGLFFWVEAQKQVVPTITIAQAIHSYYTMLDEEYDSEIAQVNFSRMRAEFINLKFNKHCEAAKEDRDDHKA